MSKVIDLFQVIRLYKLLRKSGRDVSLAYAFNYLYDHHRINADGSLTKQAIKDNSLVSNDDDQP